MLLGNCSCITLLQAIHGIMHKLHSLPPCNLAIAAKVGVRRIKRSIYFVHIPYHLADELNQPFMTVIFNIRITQSDFALIAG